MDYKIRNLKQNEVNVLNTFLCKAIFIPDGVDAPPYDIIKQPELQVYVTDFGKQKGDMCYVAETDDKIVGQYGFVLWMIMDMLMMKLRHLLYHCLKSIEIMVLELN